MTSYRPYAHPIYPCYHPHTHPTYLSPLFPSIEINVFLTNTFLTGKCFYTRLFFYWRKDMLKPYIFYHQFNSTRGSSTLSGMRTCGGWVVRDPVSFWPCVLPLVSAQDGEGQRALSVHDTAEHTFFQYDHWALRRVALTTEVHHAVGGDEPSKEKTRRNV